MAVSEGAQYNGRMTSFSVFSCMMAAMGGFIFGYGIGISGGVTSMESFLKKFFPEVYDAQMDDGGDTSNYCKFDSQLLTSFTSSLYVAGLISSFFASSVTRDFGRKPSILVGGAAFLTGAAVGGAAVNVYMLILGRLLLGVGVGFASQVTGINVVAFYAPILFRTIGLEESASLTSAVVTGIVGLFMTFISMLVVDKLGRRPLFMIGGIQMLISLAMIGGIMAATLGDNGVMDKGFAIAILFLMCIYVAGFGLSWGPLGWLVPSEIFPLEIRSAGQSITVAVNFLFTFIVAQTFLSMLCHLKWGIFFFFGGWVAVMTVFVWLLLPETKNVPIEQMDRVWREHWLWRNVMGEEEMEEEEEEEEALLQQSS